MSEKKTIAELAQQREAALKKTKSNQENNFDFFSEAKQPTQQLNQIKEEPKIVKIEKPNSPSANKQVRSKTKTVLISLSEEAERLEQELKVLLEELSYKFNRSGEYLEHLKTKISKLQKQKEILEKYEKF